MKGRYRVGLCCEAEGHGKENPMSGDEGGGGRLCVEGRVGVCCEGEGHGQEIPMSGDEEGGG